MLIRPRQGPRLYPDHRPTERGDIKLGTGCFSFPRPCPFVSCRHHLAIDSHRLIDGRLRLRVLHEDPTTMTNTCALDVADGIADIPDNPEAVGMRAYGDEAAQVDTETIAEMVGVTATRVKQHIESIQKRFRENAQLTEDYEIHTEPIKRTLIQRAEIVIMRELSKGPKHVSTLIYAVDDEGLSPSSAKHALRNLGPRVAQCSGEGVKRGTWQLVGTGKANLRHSGHPGKTGR